MSETPRMKAAQMAAMEHGTGDVYRVGCDIELELNAANDRIKQLEEAGNEMYDYCDPSRWDSTATAARKLSAQNAWNKAKNDKPVSDKTIIEWNADVGTRLLTIYPDGSFRINENTPPLYALGELAKVFMKQQDRIKRLEEALTSIGEYWNRDNNERAMEDACWHAVNTATDALQAKEAKP